MAGRDEDVDRLEAPPASRLTGAVVGVVLVLVVALGWLALAGRPSHPRASHVPVRPTPVADVAPTPVATTAKVTGGSVFLEHLARCTRSDGASHLTVAVGVTNLSRHRLRLVAASSIGTPPGLRLDDVRVGPAPCAAAAQPSAGSTDVQLEPARAVVVSLRFAIGAVCPTGVVAARMTFSDAGQALHADSSALADLSSLRFAQC